MNPIQIISDLGAMTVILALIGVIWGMRAGELKRIENSLQKEIERLDEEVKDLRKRKHDGMDLLSELSGKIHLMEDDMQDVRRKSFLSDQLRNYRIETGED